MPSLFVRFAHLRLIAATAIALGLWTASPSLQRAGMGRDRDPQLDRGRPAFTCGTERPLVAARPRAAEPLVDGAPISFQQDPPVVSPAYGGDIRIRDLQVAGDVPTVTFWSYDPETQSSTAETLTRLDTVTVAGRLVSRFEATWPNTLLQKHLRATIRGFDYPSLFWGSVQVPGTDPPYYWYIYLRLASTAIPPVAVVRVNDTAQYSSHVVNLVIPGFGDTRLSGGTKDFGQPTVTRRFYELFDDGYDSLAIVPAAPHVATFGAFHGNVKNEVEGLGLTTYDYTSFYGSAGRLQSVEVFPQARLTTNDTSTHEITHQWGHYFEWERLGLRGTDDDRAHTPLLFAGETLVGIALEGKRRVRQTATAQYEIERTPPPIRAHPLDLYAMGLLGPQDVPDVWIFEDQLQFAGMAGLPLVGATVRGGARRVSINDVLGLEGPRRGPVPTTWRRATVVVSRDRLVSPEEMSYWNFFAARLADPTRTGVMSYDGYVSFDAMTGNRIDLQTDIVPRGAPAVPSGAAVEPRFGRFDCRDFDLTASIPSRVRAGEEVRVEGRVTATDQRFNQVLLRFWKYGGTTDNAVRVSDAVSASGAFALRALFREGEDGAYYAQLFLFWPDAPAQDARCTLSPVIVDKAQ